MTVYKNLAAQLQANFPPGTVKATGKNKAHIPVQAYMKRLEDVAKEHWHWAIIDMPQLDYQNAVVFVKGELIIGDTRRQGIGVATFKAGESGTIKTATATAESEAFRDACDKFLMGWKDLAPYRDWANNPAINLVSSQKVEPVTEIRTCLKCNKTLEQQDLAFLAIHNINLSYCSEHVPKHFIKER